MRLTRLAPDANRLISVFLLGIWTFHVAAQVQESSIPVLDLTGPRPREEQGVSGAVGPGIPGRSIGGIGGVGRIPRPYALPLLVRLQSVSPQRVAPGDKFTVELILLNAGGLPYFLPASQKAATIKKQGNKGRRTFLFSLVFEDSAGNVVFEDPPGYRKTSWLMTTSDGSDSIPDSFLRIQPGQSVRVVFTADLHRIRDRFTPDLKQLRVRAQISEWMLEDECFFVENSAEPVLSDNATMIELVK